MTLLVWTIIGALLYFTCSYVRGTLHRLRSDEEWEIPPRKLYQDGTEADSGSQVQLTKDMQDKLNKIGRAQS